MSIETYLLTSLTFYYFFPEVKIGADVMDFDGILQEDPWFIVLLRNFEKCL
jgi:hypothetical protein